MNQTTRVFRKDGVEQPTGGMGVNNNNYARLLATGVGHFPRMCFRLAHGCRKGNPNTKWFGEGGGGWGRGCGVGGVGRREEERGREGGRVGRWAAGGIGTTNQGFEIKNEWGSIKHS